MKKIFVFAAALFICGCSDNDNITKSGLREHGARFTLGLSTNLSTSVITPAELQGKWRLIDSKFTSDYKTINNLTAYYELEVNECIMEFGENGIQKPVFYNPVKFADGTHNSLTGEPIKTFLWTPGSGHPAITVYIKYTENKLTLIYSSTLPIHGKLYPGVVYETYIKAK